ncbi:MAG TPA: hypothetical protein VGU45_06865 [Microvirga sp.]|nr:hypothetical protein [Microvirga sp.]
MITSHDPVVTGREIVASDRGMTLDALGNPVVAQALIADEKAAPIVLAELPPVTVSPATIIVSELMEQLAYDLPATPMPDPLDRWEPAAEQVAADMEAIVDLATGSIGPREILKPYVPHEAEDALTKGIAHPYVQRHTLKLPGRV